MESVQSHVELARALSSHLSVYLVDRRGRGLSDPHGPNYCLAREVEDIKAVVVQTGASRFFGVSSGAVVGMAASFSIPEIENLAIYEPALIVDGSKSTNIQRYRDEIAAGKTSAALVTAMLTAEMGPAWMRTLPRWILEAITKFGMNHEDRSARPGDVTMRQLAPTIGYDFQLIDETAQRLDWFSTLRPKILLMGGAASPPWLKTPLNALEGVLPNARRVEFQGVGHGGSGNANRGGQPAGVASTLVNFFGC